MKNILSILFSIIVFLSGPLTTLYGQQVVQTINIPPGTVYTLPNEDWTHPLNATQVNLTGGKLILTGNWNGFQLYAVHATGGSINIDSNETFGPTILNLTIAGNVNVQGAPGFGLVNEYTYKSPYAPTFVSITINSGTVNLNEVSMWRNNHFVINGGDVTLTKGMFANDNGNQLTGDPNKKVDASITLINGKLTLGRNEFPKVSEGLEITNKYLVDIKGGECVLTDQQDASEFEPICGNCLFNVQQGGKLTVSKGSYSTNARVNDDLLTFIQSEGEVNIEGGEFSQERIIIKGGKLSVSKGTFKKPAAYDGKNNSCFYVLGDTDIKLSGGTYEGKAFYIDQNATGVTAEKMLADRYGYYTIDQNLQPDVRYKPTSRNVRNGDYVTIYQIKSINDNTPANNCRDAALSANVGTEGTDVKVIPLSNGSSYDYEIYTPAGLCWLMTAMNGYWNEQEYEVTAPTTDYHKFDRKNSTVYLMADLDMSGYNWIPIGMFSAKKLDGQGHRIFNLSVNQASATFINQIGTTVYSAGQLQNVPTEISNLVISGKFNSINTIYDERLNKGVFGLVTRISAGSKIVNCGVENSTLSYNYKDASVLRCAGLVGFNDGEISNSYFTGTISGTLTYEDMTPSLVKMGNLAAENGSEGKIDNVYTNASLPQLTLVPTDMDASKIKIDELCPDQKGAMVNCYVTSDAASTLETLNKGVEEHIGEQGETPWKLWISKEDRNSGLPIHGTEEKPTVVVMPFTLSVQGNGELKGYYIKGEGEEPTLVQDTVRFNATASKDTTVKFTNGRTYHVIAQPYKGSSLDSLVLITNDSIAETIKDYTAFTDTSFLIKQPTKVVAYFHTDTLYVEKDTTVIGGVGEITKVDHVQISNAGTNEKPAVIQLGNVQVVPKESGEGEDNPEATTQIEASAYVVLELSGKNNLGTLINEGTTTIMKNPDETMETSLKTTSVVNKGTLIDETGYIINVAGDTGENAETLLTIENSNKKIEVTENESVTLEAEATIPSDATVSFQWQVLKDGEWEELGESTSYPLQTKVRKANLRAEGKNKTYTATYTTEPLTNDSPLQYRCLITTETTKSGDQSNKVSTTLTTYSTVTVSAKPEEKSFTITFNANGGTVDKTTAQTGTDGRLTSLPTPTRSDYTFDGWFTAAENGEMVTTSTVFYSDATIHAHWTKVTEPDPDPDPDPTPDPTPDPWYTYYDVVLPEVKGATTDPKAGTYELIEGGNFKFKLILDPAYSKSEVVVKIGEELLTPDTDGYYHIKNIKADLVITITGITLDNPVGNATVEQPLKVWCNQSVLHIYTAERTPVHIYSLNGRLIHQFEVCGSTSISDLSHGHYIVQIGNRVWKIVL